MRIIKKRKDGKVQAYHIKVMSLAKRIVRALKPYCERIMLAGSIRRKKIASDIDIVLVVKGDSKEDLYLDSEGIIRTHGRIGGNFNVWKKNHDAIWSYIHKAGKIKAYGMHNLLSTINGVGVDVFFSTPDSFESQLMTRTGPAGSNIFYRTIARKKGWLLNQYGIFDRKTGKRIAIKEKDIYHKLGRSYRPPELRGSPR
jgi:DNA polymerase/3'-5' exonuclease PolX